MNWLAQLGISFDEATKRIGRLFAEMGEIPERQEYRRRLQMIGPFSPQEAVRIERWLYADWETNGTDHYDDFARRWLMEMVRCPEPVYRARVKQMLAQDPLKED